jgi:hypothetical protein
LVLANSLTADGAVDPTRRESAFRMAAAALLALLCLAFNIGMTWDIQWHSDVGPDSFWTAPHSLMYGGIAGAGAVALGVVVLTTSKLRRGDPAVTEASTTGWIFGLRAPLGFLLAGHGALGFLLCGLFDLWWHTVYGFDVTLLSPPHFGLLFSAMAMMLGSVYTFASEGTRIRLGGHGSRWNVADVGFAISVATLMAELGIFLAVGILDLPFAGPFILYPLMGAMIFPTGLLAAASFLRRPGAATLVAVLFTALRVVHWYAAPFGVKVLANVMMLDYQQSAIRFPVIGYSLPAYLIVVGLLIDAVIFFARRGNLSWRLSAMLAAGVAWTVSFLIDPRYASFLYAAGWAQKEAQLLGEYTAAVLPTLPAVFLLAALCGSLGWSLGLTFRYTDR